MTNKRKNPTQGSISHTKGRKDEGISTKRPKRQIVSKSVDNSAGLSWREETDLKKALYASLQESKRLYRGQDDDPSPPTCTSKLTHHHSRVTRGLMSASSRKPSTVGRFSMDDTCSSQDSVASTSTQESKKTTVHAQRKFAQVHSQPCTPSTTPVKVHASPVKLFSKRAKTEDFLTFLCLRGSSVLPPHLDFFGYSRDDSQMGESSRPNTPGQGVRCDSGETRESTPDFSSSDSDMRDEVPELASLIMKNQQTPTRKAARASASTPETARGFASIRPSMTKKVGKVPAKALLKRSKTLLASPSKMSPRGKRAMLRHQRSPSKTVRVTSYCPGCNSGPFNIEYCVCFSKFLQKNFTKLINCKACYVNLGVDLSVDRYNVCINCPKESKKSVTCASGSNDDVKNSCENVSCVNTDFAKGFVSAQFKSTNSISSSHTVLEDCDNLGCSASDSHKDLARLGANWQSKLTPESCSNEKSNQRDDSAGLDLSKDPGGGVMCKARWVDLGDDTCKSFDNSCVNVKQSFESEQNPEDSGEACINVHDPPFGQLKQIIQDTETSICEKRNVMHLNQTVFPGRKPVANASYWPLPSPPYTVIKCLESIRNKQYTETMGSSESCFKSDSGSSPPCGGNSSEDKAQKGSTSQCESPLKSLENYPLNACSVSDKSWDQLQCISNSLTEVAYSPPCAADSSDDTGGKHNTAQAASALKSQTMSMCPYMTDNSVLHTVAENSRSQLIRNSGQDKMSSPPCLHNSSEDKCSIREASPIHEVPCLRPDTIISPLAEYFSAYASQDTCTSHWKPESKSNFPCVNRVHAANDAIEEMAGDKSIHVPVYRHPTQTETTENLSSLCYPSVDIIAGQESSLLQQETFCIDSSPQDTVVEGITVRGVNSPRPLPQSPKSLSTLCNSSAEAESSLKLEALSSLPCFYNSPVEQSPGHDSIDLDGLSFPGLNVELQHGLMEEISTWPSQERLSFENLTGTKWTPLEDVQIEGGIYPYLFSSNNQTECASQSDQTPSSENSPTCIIQHNSQSSSRFSLSSDSKGKLNQYSACNGTEELAYSVNEDLILSEEELPVLQNQCVFIRPPGHGNTLYPLPPVLVSVPSLKSMTSQSGSKKCSEVESPKPVRASATPSKKRITPQSLPIGPLPKFYIDDSDSSVQSRDSKETSPNRRGKLSVATKSKPSIKNTGKAMKFKSKLKSGPVTKTSSKLGKPLTAEKKVSVKKLKLATLKSKPKESVLPTKKITRLKEKAKSDVRKKRKATLSKNYAEDIDDDIESMEDVEIPKPPMKVRKTAPTKNVSEKKSERRRKIVAASLAKMVASKKLSKIKKVTQSKEKKTDVKTDTSLALARRARKTKAAKVNESDEIEERTQKLSVKPAVSPVSTPKRGRPRSLTRTPSKDKCDPPAHFPAPGNGGHIVEVPTFYPSPKEFQDPYQYIASIRSRAEPYGMCRVVPPASWKPECKVNDELRFTSQLQYIHKMQNRWGPNVQQMECIRKHLASINVDLDQPPLVGGIEVDLPKLHQTLQVFGGDQNVADKKTWIKVADAMKIPKLAQDRATKLYDAYCKYLLSYDTLSYDEKTKLELQVMMERQKKQKSQKILDDSVVKGKSTSLGDFNRVARNTVSMWFKDDPSAEQVESEYWKLVQDGQNHVVVQCGHVDTRSQGSAFPVKRDSPCARHGWNFNILAQNSKSVLKAMGPVTGVTIPTLHIGMLFTTSCWSTDLHLLPYIQYLHTGADTVWYSVPESEESKFKSVLTSIVPELVTDSDTWLSEDTVMVSPDILSQKGVSLGRCVQKPGQFMVVFSHCHTATVSCGYSISESVHFAYPDWIPVSVDASKRLNKMGEPELFSVEGFLCNLIKESSNKDMLTVALPQMKSLIESEGGKARQLMEDGLKVTKQMAVKEAQQSSSGKRKSVENVGRDDCVCDICKKVCHLFMVVSDSDDSVFCLDHAAPFAQRKKNFKGSRLLYRYTEEELENIIQLAEEKLGEVEDSQVETPEKSVSGPKRRSVSLRSTTSTSSS